MERVLKAVLKSSPKESNSSEKDRISFLLVKSIL
jgi:hypothetical protein